MTINTTYQAPQIRAYLNGILKLSFEDELPCIDRALLAKTIGVAQTTFNNFLRTPTCFSPTVVQAFANKYPEEIAKWPKKSTRLGRVIVKADAIYFLKIQVGPIKFAAKFKKEGLEKKVSKKGAIAISYRGHQTNKDGMGMVFDHIRFQKVTGHPTKPLLPDDEAVKQATQTFFKDELANHGVKLPSKPTEVKRFNEPAPITDFEDEGLLVIPGRVRAIEDEPVRWNHETAVIRQALNRGQPILGLCAGSWRVFDGLKEWIDAPAKPVKTKKALQAWRDLPTMIEVNDHSYARMIGLQKKGTETTYNVTMHKVALENQSLVQKMMSNKGRRQLNTPVNSVHWNAVYEKSIPYGVQVSARSKEDPSVEQHNRHGDLLEPEEDAVEAFETTSGSPVIGVQWHPEAYVKTNPSGRLLLAMAQAGDAYAAKRRMLEEFKKHYQ